MHDIKNCFFIGGVMDGLWRWVDVSCREVPAIGRGGVKEGVYYRRKVVNKIGGTIQEGFFYTDSSISLDDESVVERLPPDWYSLHNAEHYERKAEPCTN